LATVAIDGAYRYAPPASVLAGFRYGVAIPKLCASADDCRSSLGSDVRVELGSRFHAPLLGLLRPLLDLGFGYEWYTSRLSDQGVTSSRSYRGPVLLFLRLGGDFRLSRAVRIGPSFGASLAAARDFTLEAPGLRQEGATAGAGFHGFVELAVRVAARF
jgi:hypothetical protein